MCFGFKYNQNTLHFTGIHTDCIQTDNNGFASSLTLNLMFSCTSNYILLKLMCNQCYQLWGPQNFGLDWLVVLWSCTITLH
jgi:hypothetical protein